MSMIIFCISNLHESYLQLIGLRKKIQENPIEIMGKSMVSGPDLPLTQPIDIYIKISSHKPWEFYGFSGDFSRTFLHFCFPRIPHCSGEALNGNDVKVAVDGMELDGNGLK